MPASSSPLSELAGLLLLVSCAAGLLSSCQPRCMAPCEEGLQSRYHASGQAVWILYGSVRQVKLPPVQASAILVWHVWLAEGDACAACIVCKKIAWMPQQCSWSSCGHDLMTCGA